MFPPGSHLMAVAYANRPGGGEHHHQAAGEFLSDGKTSALRAVSVRRLEVVDPLMIRSR